MANVGKRHLGKAFAISLQLRVLQYNNFMKKFRVLSDLHLDVNEKFPLELQDKEIFTVICGDTAGITKMGIDWIRKNVKSGICVSGNHLPYNDLMQSIQEQRDNLAKEFPIDAPMSYFDVECNAFFKEVDGILFIGTCMYSDMRISAQWNADGDFLVNCNKALRTMNDYHHGIKSIEKDEDGNVKRIERITPKDYAAWFKHAYDEIEKKISENEASANPKSVVLITHFPVIKKLLDESYYVDPDNLASYGSDHEKWIHAHPSIKCYCSGHAHSVSKDFRNYYIERADGTKCLVVSNTRGYVYSGHDYFFNPNTFVDTETWTIQVEPESAEEIKRKEKQNAKYLALAPFFM